MYYFAIDGKLLLPLKNVPMFQSSFLFSIILPTRKSGVKFSRSPVMKKIYEIEFFQLFGHKVHQEQSTQTEHLRQAQTPSSINQSWNIAFCVHVKKIPLNKTLTWK